MNDQQYSQAAAIRVLHELVIRCSSNVSRENHIGNDEPLT